MTNLISPAPIDPPTIENAQWYGFHGNVGWDVGANCGQSINKMLGLFRTVHSFEPAVESYQYLQEHFGYRLDYIHNIALSDVDGQIRLAALPDKISTGQLITPGTHGMEDWGDVEAGVERFVKARRVDTLIYDEAFEVPDFMKIDVEGHEFNILKGAPRLLKDNPPAMLIEIHSPELGEACGDLLKRANYRLETIRHPHYPEGSAMWYQHFWYRAWPK